MIGKYRKTIYACFIGYVIQAIVNNFAPLLFLTFQKQYQIPLSQITMLVTFNFMIQLCVDLLAAKFVDKIGYRVSMVSAHICAGAGLMLMTVLPGMMPHPFAGLLIAVCIYAIGGGLLEVVVSPVVEACPSENKEKTMSLLHSFYCWGHVGVVLLSTLFFAVFGIENWGILSCVWAVLAIANGINFAKVPIAPLVEEDSELISLKELFNKKLFWLFVLMMICSGASEQAVSQWASTFAEKGIGVSKVIGDLAGPMFFAAMMGSSRTFFGKYGDKLNLDRYMKMSAILCVAAYLSIALIPNSVIGLLGCGICGLSVGIFWPGTFSKASKEMRNAGTSLFAILALAGDLGCSAGPTVVGFVSSHFGDNLHIGILTAVVFPVLLIGCLMMENVKKWR